MGFGGVRAVELGFPLFKSISLLSGLTLTALLFPCAVEDRELPTVTIKIMEPKAHVRRAGTFRPDFVARIFDLDPHSLQVFECLSQYCHARQVKRHVTDRFRRWFSFEQSDRHVLVPNRDTILIFEFNGQAERTLELGRISLAPSKSTLPQLERRFERVGEIGRDAGLCADSMLDELAARKLRFDHPDLARQWDALQQQQRKAALQNRQPTQSLELDLGRTRSLSFSSDS